MKPALLNPNFPEKPDFDDNYTLQDFSDMISTEGITSVMSSIYYIYRSDFDMMRNFFLEFERNASIR